MQACHHVHAQQWKERQCYVVSECPVSQQDVALAQMAPDLLRQRGVMIGLFGGDEVQCGTAPEAEEGEHLHDRESTALRLARGLWKALLVSGCVGQTEGGCVDEADVPALEQREAWSPSACRLHRMMERLVKDSDGEAAASPGEGPCSDRAGLGRGELQQRAKVMTRFPKGGLGVEGLVGSDG